MYQVALKFWNEIAKSQALSEPWFTLFRASAEDLPQLVRVLIDAPLENAGADGQVILAYRLVAPLLVENEAISAYIVETEQLDLRAGLPEVLSVDEAVHLAELEYQLTPAQSELLAQLLEAALLDSQGPDGKSDEQMKVLPSTRSDLAENAQPSVEGELSGEKVSTQTASPAYKLRLDFGDLSKALRTLIPRKRLSTAGQIAQLDIGFLKGEAVFSTGGRQARCNATGVWPGYATSQLRHALGILTFKPDTKMVVIEFQGDRLRFESLRIPARWMGASELSASVCLEANFLEVFSMKSRLYCTACGNRAGIHLNDYVPKKGHPEIDLSISALVDQTDATHGCVDCGHGWIELADRPNLQLRLC